MKHRSTVRRAPERLQLMSSEVYFAEMSHFPPFSPPPLHSSATSEWPCVWACIHKTHSCAYLCLHVRVCTRRCGSVPGLSRLSAYGFWESKTSNSSFLCRAEGRRLIRRHIRDVCSRVCVEAEGSEPAGEQVINCVS